MNNKNKYKEELEELTEIDFCPPYDNRLLKSNIYDIYGGDNFANYCEEFFELLDEEEYYD